MRRHLLLLGACLPLLSARARAEQTPSLALMPAPAGDPMILTEPAQVRGDAHFRGRVLGVYASQPLVLQNQDQEYDHVVESQLWLHALASLSLAHRYQVSLDLPLLLEQRSGVPPSHGGTATRPRQESMLGDVRVGGRMKLFGPAGDGEHLAVALGASLPTGESYAGDDGFGGRATVLADGHYSRFVWASELGARVRPGARLPGIVPTRVGSELLVGVAQSTFIDARRLVALSSEISASLTVGEGARFLDPRGARAHFLIAARVRPITELEIGVGFGPDLGQAPGAADFRALAFLGYSPEVVPPPPDQDDDRVPDRVDACIDLPGVPAADPQMNGCPEVPPDFDADEIPDQHDACPKDPGIPTGDRLTHGCPKPVDGDGDGIVDRDDSCPRQSGIRSEDRRKHGCPPPPPPPPPAARIEAQAVVISEQVQFDHGTAVIRNESDGILSQVAKLLEQHPELEQIEVAGHTDDSGTALQNQRLSEDRAAAVVKWLIARGTAPSRLWAKGYGQSAPVADNSTEDGRSKNRRVEFRITKRTPPKEATP